MNSFMSFGSHLACQRLDELGDPLSGLKSFVEEMAALIKSAVDIRDRSLMLLMAKTGVLRGELIAVDATDINFADQSIFFKAHAQTQQPTSLF